jgi:glycosyltransferase involved in cell wall biosynthesis
MDLTTRVSIGIPVFNGEPFLEETIDSILAQTYEDFELIISDNHSSDRTEEICRRYTEKDERVRYVRNRENLGAAYNYNQVFHLSSGEYFKWAAHDDVLMPHFLERCVEALDADPAAVVSYTRWRPIDEAGNPITKRYPVWRVIAQDPVERFRFSLLMDGKTQLPIFGLFRSDVLSRTGLHRATPSGDSILIAEVSLYGPFREVEEDMFIHRWHGGRSVLISSFRDRVNWWRPVSRAGRIGRGPAGAAVLFAWAIAQVAASHVDSVRRSPLPPRHKARAYAQIVVWLGDQLRLRVKRRLPMRK